MKCAEIKVMTVRECSTEYVCKTPADIGGVLGIWQNDVSKSAWYQEDKEMFVVFFLSARNRIIGYNLVSMGLVSSSLVHAREVYRPAILAGASAVIISHNHPSGDTAPSAEDLRITRDLVDAGKLLDLPLRDHIIIGQERHDQRGFLSLRENGMINFAV